MTERTKWWLDTVIIPEMIKFEDTKQNYKQEVVFNWKEGKLLSITINVNKHFHVPEAVTFND